MIQIKRDARSLTILFDRAEAEGLIEQLLRSTGRKGLMADAYWADGSGPVVLSVRRFHEEGLRIAARSVELLLDAESIEYAVHKLDEIQRFGSPSTPEFIQIDSCMGSSGKRLRAVQLYFAVRGVAA